MIDLCSGLTEKARKRKGKERKAKKKGGTSTGKERKDNLKERKGTNLKENHNSPS